MTSSAERKPSRKRPYNLLLNEENVHQARNFTSNISATVDSLLADFVVRQNRERATRQQLGDSVSEAWNRFRATHGSFADEHSTL